MLHGLPALCEGIIPAYAGSTSIFGRGSFSTSDHPRLRGEHGQRARTRPRSSGSSPLTRGALPYLVCATVAWGIIPAYAGSTSLAPPCRMGTGNHPRLRGEHRSTTIYSYYTEGSSPLTRGALEYILDLYGSDRIIPAYAGSTCRVPQRLLQDGIIPAYAGSTPPCSR